MKISVIIPVYNADKYLQSAVESALIQEETGEVILVEDGSPDESLQVCRDLAEKNEAVVLYRHPDLGNHGAGESRNLGIKKATCEYIAFLDADDFYLPGRFKVAKRLFSEKKGIDGVYEAIGVHFEDEAARKTWASHGGDELTILPQKIPPEDLFSFMLGPNSGTFSLDGLVVKKSLFKKCGYFFKHLRLHQDTAMTFQMSESGRLYPGRIEEAVAMRRVHSSNRIFSSYNRNKTQYLMWQTLYHWARQKKTSRAKLSKLYIKYQDMSLRLAYSNHSGRGIDYHYLRSFLMESVISYSLSGSLLKYCIERILINLNKRMSRA